MIDPVSLTLGGIVAGLVWKMVDTTGEAVAQGAIGAVTGLVERVREHLRGDPEGEAAMERVEDPPAAPAHLKALAESIDRHTFNDPGFARELEDLVAQARQGGANVESVVQSAWGNDNIQVANTSGSTITINRPDQRA